MIDEAVQPGAPDPPSRSPEEDARLGIVTGDRRCANCRYNLRGQPIVRERHYGLVLVRCPECSQVAALDEYPHFVRTIRRWRVVSTAAWLLLILAGLLGTAAVSFIWLETLSYEASEVGAYLADEYIAWREARVAAGQPVSTPPGWVASSSPGGTTIPEGWVETAWAQTLDRSEVIRNTGGWWRNLGVRNWWSVAVQSIWLLWFGLFFGVCLSRVSRWIVLAILLLGATGVVLVYDATAPGSRGFLWFTNQRWAGGWAWSYSLATEWTRPYQARFTATVAYILLATGILIARPLLSMVLHLTVHPQWAGLRHAAGTLRIVPTFKRFFGQRMEPVE